MRLHWFTLLLCSCVLAGCGGQAAQTTLPQPTTPLAATPAATATLAPTVATQAATAQTTTDIPESLTPEGYHVLGDPNAPITLVMYSDFL